MNYHLMIISQTYDGVGKSYGGSDGHGADKGGGRKEQLLNRGGTMPPSFECYSEDTLKTSCSD